MAQFRRSIQPIGFRPEQVSDKNISQLQAYSDRISNALREERDAVISNRNRTADALKENARIEEGQLTRDADTRDKNIQNKIREQDLIAQKARQDFQTKTEASKEIFGTLSTLSTSAALKLQEIEMEGLKEEWNNNMARVLTLGDNAPEVKYLSGLYKDAQIEVVKSSTEIAKAQEQGLSPVEADRYARNINDLDPGTKAGYLMHMLKKYPTYLNEQFMDKTKQYTDSEGNTFTGQEAGRLGKRASVVAAEAMTSFMDINRITGITPAFLQKVGFIPGILAVNQGVMNTAEKAEREDYQEDKLTDVRSQIFNAKTPEDVKNIVEVNKPELVRLLGKSGFLDFLQKTGETVNSDGDPLSKVEGIFAAEIGEKPGETFGSRWLNRKEAVLKTLTQAKNAAFQEAEATNRANASRSAQALLPELRRQLEAADPQDDQSVIATIKKQFFDTFNGFIPPEIINLERQNLDQNSRLAKEQANLVLEKIRTGQATQGDVLSIADPELRAKVQEQFRASVFDANYGTNYKENVKKAQAAAKQIMGDSLEGSGGVEAQRLADVITKNFVNDYREGLRLYKDPARAEEYALDKMQKDKDAALLNQDKNARYYSVVGPNNQKVFKNVRSIQAQTAAQRNAALDQVRQTLKSAGLNGLNSPGLLGTESELRSLSEANLTGEVLKFTPQIKEAAKIYNLSELEVANKAIAAYNQYNTVKIAPLKLDPTLRAVNDARPETRALLMNYLSKQRALRAAAEIQQTSLRDPGNIRASIVQYVTGQPSMSNVVRGSDGKAVIYDPIGHGGQNYHNHYQFSTAAERKRVESILRTTIDPWTNQPYRITSTTKGLDGRTHRTGTHGQGLSMDVAPPVNLPVDQEEAWSAHLNRILGYDPLTAN